MIQRFIHSLICCLLVWMVILAAASPVRAAEGKLVAVVLTGNLERYRTVQQAFLQSLNRAHVKVYTQTPNPDPMSLANSVRKAVAINADLIVTYGAQAAMAAKREAGSVPVLFADVYDPVSLGLVKCLEDVSCDVSGISASTPLNTLLKTLSDLAPLQRTIAALYSENDPGSARQVLSLKELAGSLDFKVETYDLSSV